MIGRLHFFRLYFPNLILPKTKVKFNYPRLRHHGKKQLAEAKQAMYAFKRSGKSMQALMNLQESDHRRLSGFLLSGIKIGGSVSGIACG